MAIPSPRAALRSITDVFKVENVYDGLAIGGGIVGALGLPAMVSNWVPAAWKAKLPLGIKLTSGWFGYVMNAASAGLLGYLVSLLLKNKRRGQQVFLGGIGATMAKIILDNLPMVRGWVGGVSLNSYGDYNLQRMVDEEVAAELGDYATPGAVMAATALGDYATPTGVMEAVSLGAYPGGSGEFEENGDFDAF